MSILFLHSFVSTFCFANLANIWFFSPFAARASFAPLLIPAKLNGAGWTPSDGKYSFHFLWSSVVAVNRKKKKSQINWNHHILWCYSEIFPTALPLHRYTVTKDPSSQWMEVWVMRPKVTSLFIFVHLDCWPCFPSKIFTTLDATDPHSSFTAFLYQRPPL